MQCVSNEWPPYTRDAAASYRNTLIQPVGSPRNHQRNDESSSITSAIDTHAGTYERVCGTAIVASKLTMLEKHRNMGVTFWY